MKSERFFIVFLTAALLVACKNEPEMNVTWHKSAAMPSPRACAASFVIDDQAYFFAGRDSAGKHLNDLWRYDTNTDTWDSIGEAPMSERVNPTSCVKDGKVYLGLGFNGKHGRDSSYLRDWWE